MKKLALIISIVIFSISLSAFAVLETRVRNIDVSNKKLTEKVNSLTDNNEQSKKENEEYEEKISNLKNDKISEIKEEEIWKETKEKLEKAIS